MGEFASAALNLLLLIVVLGLLTALFGLPGFIAGFAVVALGSTVGNVGAIGVLTAVIGGLVFVLVIGMTISFGDKPPSQHSERPDERRPWRRPRP
jgi:hypothetical protein